MEELNLPQPDETKPGLPLSAESSVLGRVLSEAESQEKVAAKPLKLVNNILANLRSRERDVLMARYGLTSEQTDKETLESIGKRLQVTRERIRQIESAALKKIGKKYLTQLKPFIKLVSAYMESHGGVAEMEELAKYFDLESDVEGILDQRALHLIMSAYDKAVSLKKQPLFKEGWAFVTVDQNELLKIQTIIQQILEKNGQSLSEAELINLVHQQIPDIDTNLIAGVLLINPKVGLDYKGNWGLSSWAVISPKRIRDKVWLALDEMGKPLHFEKIASLITRKYPKEKPVLSRTVHNELIGDDRFVLVGRGIYALKKWGYKVGVVSDVIKDVLVKAGKPQQVTEIIAEVLKMRQVKKNTIVANLQNRKLFKKVAKSTYTIVEDSTSDSAPVNN